MSHSLRNVTTEGAVLGGVIAQLRADCVPALTQQELAGKMGLSPSAWSRVEKGETELTALQLKRVAQFLDTDATTILRLTDELAEKLEKDAGISVEATTIKSLISGQVDGLTAVAGKMGLTAAVPVMGPILGGILSTYMRLRSDKKD